MDNKNLGHQATRPGKRITIEYLPAQLVELSEKDLQQIVGGVAFGGTGEWEDKRHMPIYDLQIVGGVAFGGIGNWTDR
jgi:bacteriocin-like protein